VRKRNERIATDEHEAVVSIPDVVGVAIVGVEPLLVAVVLHVEHVEVAVRVGYVRCAVYITIP